MFIPWVCPWAPMARKTCRTMRPMRIVKTFWENKDRLAGDQPWWDGVNESLVQ